MISPPRRETKPPDHKGPTLGSTFWDPMPMTRDEGIGNAIRIALVGVNVGVGGGAFTWLGDPLIMQLIKNLVTSVFKGTNEDG